jgi:enoyl-[acyl-carrier-protein] reductase (NADH)
MIANIAEKVKMLTKMQTPLRKLAIPEEVADTVLFLISDRSSHITGQNIHISGGAVMS